VRVRQSAGPSLIIRSLNAAARTDFRHRDTRCNDQSAVDAMIPASLPVGVLLAGGLARRMGGGDKPLLTLAGRPLLAHAAAALAPQCTALVLNANGDPARFAAFGLPVVADTLPGHPGPLAGILAGMRWAAAHHPGRADILTIAADTPLLPGDFGARLAAARGTAPIACARSGGWTHPTAALWPVALADRLEAAIRAGARGVLAWATGEGLALADFAAEPHDPFFNINTPQDLAAAEAGWRDHHRSR
jgi:molybdopterin-guanine dinucleotide biosynthesis protein A